jgi:hypothetical protein
MARFSPLASSSSDRSRGTKTAVRSSRERVKQCRRIDVSRIQSRAHEQSRASANTPQTSIAGEYTPYDHVSSKVPDDVDNRSAYGRRQSPDFGFPGARIKPHITLNIHKAPLSSDDWIKRVCGHFSRRSRSDFGDDSPGKLCHRCSDKCMTRDEDNNSLFHDLSQAIDAILEEHTSTLRNIINDIKQGRAERSHDQEASPDLAPSEHDFPQQPFDYQTSHRQVHYRSKKAAAKGRVEETSSESTERGVPDLDDPKRSLERSIKSFQDLYDLINSAAEDLGLDLDRRPNKEDDDMFRGAPMQKASPTPVQVHHQSPKGMENMGVEKAHQNDCSRLNPSCHHFRELSGTRIQIVDEFGSILEDISIQKPRVFEIKLLQSELPTSNGNDTLLLQIGQCPSMQLANNELNRRSGWEQLNLRSSLESHPTHTANDSPPPTGLSIHVPSTGRRRDDHGKIGIGLARRATKKSQSSTSSPYTTPCEYKERQIEAFTPTSLPKIVSQKTCLGSESTPSTTHRMNDHSTILPKAILQDHTDLQLIPASHLSTVRRTARKQHHTRCLLPTELIIRDSSTYLPSTPQLRRPSPTHQTSIPTPPSDPPRASTPSNINPHAQSQFLTTRFPTPTSRRPSAAAPGIAAPSATVPPESRNPPPRKLKRRRKIVNYPPELQYPRPSALPARQTPVWTRLDTQTPPPRTGVKEDGMRKKRGRDMCGLCFA